MEHSVGRRQQVLVTLRNSRKSRTVTQLAKILDVHGNTVRFHLKSLLGDGLIEIDDDQIDDRTVGRPAVRYRAAERVTPSNVRHYETLSRLLLEDLEHDPDGSQRAHRIGVAWGRRQAHRTSTPIGSSELATDVRALAGLLTDMGFEPDPPTEKEILLRSCPFLDPYDEEGDLAEAQNSDGLPVVCSIHLGVMSGALSEWGGSANVEKLTPFARPDRCRIQLKRQ